MLVYARRRGASGSHVRGGALSLDAGGVKYTLSIRAGRSRPVTGFPRRVQTGTVLREPKTLSRLASGLQYASLSGAAPILLEPRGRTNSASKSHSSTSLQGNDEFAVETSIVHNAAAVSYTHLTLPTIYSV